MKTIILGLGNPILSDDGVGNRVALELEDKLAQRQDVTVMETSMSGLSLIDLLAGYDKAIIVDAIQTAEGAVGQIYRLAPDAFNNTRHASSPHDVNFATALELGSKLGIAMPKQIVIYAIEVADTSTFSEEFTPKVKRAIPKCVRTIIKELNGNHHA
ncbi:MAG: hydrogenase maturation protease [Chloroflexi bacterium]|jgi:hydrogenase maturation protease|nr:hydrogenase maturation protease [Chloroflexota bacterium]